MSSQAATVKQTDYIAKILGSCPETITQEQASAILDCATSRYYDGTALLQAAMAAGAATIESAQRTGAFAGATRNHIRMCGVECHRADLPTIRTAMAALAIQVAE